MTTSPAYALNVDLLAPVRKPKERVVPPRPDIPRATSAQLTVALEVVRKSNWVETFSPLMPDNKRAARGIHPGGRRTEMSLEALLVGCLLLTMMERPLIIRDIHRLLNFGIDAGTRRRFGISHKRDVTERMVSRMFNNLARTMNASSYFESNAWLFDAQKVRTVLGLAEDAELSDWDHAYFINETLTENAKRLDQFIHAGLRATHPTHSGHSGDYSIDGSYISSWERPRTTRRKTTWVDADGKIMRRDVRPSELADPDARPRIKRPSKKSGRIDGVLGYVLSALTWTEEDLGPNKRGADIPNLIGHLSLVPANRYPTLEASNLIDRMVAHHEIEDALAGREHRQRGDILSDREYSCDPAWQRRMFEAGFTPHFMLTKYQREQVLTLPSGIVIIDGIPYSPGIPEALRVSPSPGLFETRDTRAANAAFYLQRKPYRIKAFGGARADDGSIKAYCGASVLAKSSIKCANKPESKKGRADRIEIGTALPIIGMTPLPPICAQSTVTIPFEQMPFWQPHIPGTPEHQWSFNRRNTVENNFSRIKDEATQSMRRGQVRLMSMAKMSFAAVFFAMASNIVEVERWELRQAGIFSLDAVREIKKRVPRRHTRQRQAAMAERNARREAKTLLEQLEAEGETVNLETGEITQIKESPPPA